MTFIQLNFLLFLIVVFAVFYICPVKYRWIVLLCASLIFYGIAGVKYLPFIFVTSWSVWVAGKQMGKIYETQEKACSNDTLSRKEKKELKEKAKNRCRRILIGLLVLNIGILCACKFLKFAVGPISILLERTVGYTGFTAESIIVPLGISYYTFSCLSYLMDVYWKRIRHEKNYFRFLLYACYFPHILQGPIERYGRLGERLKAELRFDYRRVTFGVQLMVWGFFKMLVVSTRADIFVTRAYEMYAQDGGFVLLVAVLFDVVHLYCDFSGCMDIAGGISQIFGVELDRNFDHPFSAKSVPEFWRRWHISMGSWFRDYVYYPISVSGVVKKISRSTKGKVPDRIARVLVTLLPVSVTWVLTGLWHGTGYPYLAWGLYYAFVILMSVCFGEDLHNAAVKAGVKVESDSWKMFQAFRTSLIFAGGRLLSGPGALWKTKKIVTGIFSTFNPWVLTDGTLYKYNLNEKNFRLCVLGIILVAVVEHFELKGYSVREKLAEQGIVFRWAVYLLGVLAVIVFGMYGPGYSAASFVYMAY